MLTVESLNGINLTVRGMFTISLMLSIMCVFFTLVQQRELSMPINAYMLRMWLWDGKLRMPLLRHLSGSPVDNPRKAVRESSLTSHYIIFAPYEMLRIAIAVFLAGIVAYLALVTEENIIVGTGPAWGNRGLLIAFVVCTAFPLLMYGQSLGQKDKEMAKSRDAERNGSVVLAAEELVRSKSKA